MTAKPRLLVFESEGLWSVALRWQTGLRVSEIWEATTLLEVRAALLNSKTHLALLEATPGTAEGIWRLIRETKRAVPRAAIIVATAPSVRGLADYFREVGALWVALSPRRLDRLRPWLETPSLDGSPADDLAEFPGTDAIWERLPWNAPFPK